MGALHEGHASLIERAAREHELAVVSIFVNPTQFGPHEDFAAYPRDESADLEICSRLGTAMVFAPSVDEMYPPGDATRVEPGPIAERLEGAARPGHFAGVATVLTKLFSIVRPDAAYFGQKDFQQLRVVQRLSRDLRLGVRVVGCPIVRERDGLAMSSRNRYLSADDRQRAVALSRALRDAKDDWSRGERDPARLRERVQRAAAAPGVALEYVSVADPLTLEELAQPAERAVISLAARVGRTRLIDNMLLGMKVEELV
jgi:pantoate--beta-alanine ligase